MVKASKATLVQCDSNIKALIMMIDGDNDGGFVIEDLDEKTVLVKENKLAELKYEIQEVRLEPAAGL